MFPFNDSFNPWVLGETPGHLCVDTKSIPTRKAGLGFQKGTHVQRMDVYADIHLDIYIYIHITSEHFISCSCPIISHLSCHIMSYLITSHHWWFYVVRQFLGKTQIVLKNKLSTLGFPFVFSETISCPKQRLPAHLWHPPIHFSADAGSHPSTYWSRPATPPFPVPNLFEDFCWRNKPVKLT